MQKPKDVCGEGGKLGTVIRVVCGMGERRQQKLRARRTAGRLDWERLQFQQLNLSKASSLRSSTLSLAVRHQKQMKEPGVQVALS